MDASLIERAKAGDAAALETLLSEIAPQVHRFGLRMCRHDADAEDVLQDTLLSVTSHLGDFEGRSSLSSWVFALARSACARKRRGLKNQPHEGSDSLTGLNADAVSPERAAESEELKRTVDAALAGLPEDYREVLLLRDMEGLTAAEVADSLGISVQAVKSRLHRARAALREALKGALETGAPAASPDCPDVLAALSQKLEGDLADTDCAAMEAHLAECEACARTCSALRQALGICRSQSDAEVPRALKLRIREAIQQQLRAR